MRPGDRGKREGNRKAEPSKPRDATGEGDKGQGNPDDAGRVRPGADAPLRSGFLKPAGRESEDGKGERAYGGGPNGWGRNGAVVPPELEEDQGEERDDPAVGVGSVGIPEAMQMPEEQGGAQSDCGPKKRVARTARLCG